MSVTIRFGTDGWRGVIADEFTYENLRRVTDGTAAMILKNKTGSETPLVLIGYDRRFLSPEFAACVAGRLRALGINVKIVSGPMTTPSLSVAVTSMKAAFGIMITASHNPAEYNGFKVKDGAGRSAPTDITKQIESLIPDHSAELKINTTEVFDRFDFHSMYDRYLKSRIDQKAITSLRGSVVFDHLHGSAAGIPERLLRGSAMKVTSLHQAWDPLFGGLHPEPIDSYLGDLKREVRKRKALVGIALDGDADRLGIVDDLGRTMTPHQVFPLLVLHSIEHKGWKGKIVQAVSLGALGERVAQHFNLAFEEVPVGFKHVAERMLKEDILAGGEESGGYAVRGGLPERDGILCALLFLEMLSVRKKKPSQLVAEMEKRFGAARFKRVDLTLKKPIPDKDDFVRRCIQTLPKTLVKEPIAETRTGDGLKIILKSGAWVLLRPSGTEPLLRTYAESESWKKTDQLLAWANTVARAQSSGVSS